MTSLEKSPVILPPIDSTVTVATEGETRRGVVTDHDSLNGRPIFMYWYEQLLSDGQTTIKVETWARPEEIVDMPF